MYCRFWFICIYSIIAEKGSLKITKTKINRILVWSEIGNKNHCHKVWKQKKNTFCLTHFNTRKCYLYTETINAEKIIVWFHLKIKIKSGKLMRATVNFTQIKITQNCIRCYATKGKYDKRTNKKKEPCFMRIK